MDPSPWVQAGGVAGIFGACMVLMGTLFRIFNRQQERLADELAAVKLAHARDMRELRDENDECTRRLSIVIGACLQAGIAIPETVWQEPK